MIPLWFPICADAFAGDSRAAHWYAGREIGYPDRDTFLHSYELLSGFVDSLGFPPERTFIGVFSQGAVMAYAIGLWKGRPRPGAMLASSGFIPTVEELDLSPPLPPIALGHGHTTR